MSAASVMRPELRSAQRGEGPLAAVITPAPGERVVEVPQAYSFLLSVWHRESVLGLPVDAADAYIRPQYGCPQWHIFDPAHDPGWGYGFLVVRGGLLHRGPHRWDSSS